MWLYNDDTICALHGDVLGSYNTRCAMRRRFGCLLLQCVLQRRVGGHMQALQDTLKLRQWFAIHGLNGLVL